MTLFPKESIKPCSVSLWSRSIRPTSWPGSPRTWRTHVMPQLDKRFSLPPNEFVTICHVPTVGQHVWTRLNELQDRTEKTHFKPSNVLFKDLCPCEKYKTVPTTAIHVQQLHSWFHNCEHLNQLDSICGSGDDNCVNYLNKTSPKRYIL